MSDLEAVLAHVDVQAHDYVARLMEYVRQPSISAQRIGMDEAAMLACDIISERLGMEAELLPTAGFPCILARHGPIPDKPTVLIYGHYDVQPPEPYEAWLSPPFEPTIRNGRVYARGVGDNKAQHFAHILALEAWHTVHGSFPCNVILMLEGEEEVGSPNLAGFVREHRERLAADFVVISDGHLHESGQPVICFGNRGFVSFELHARTGSRDAHSGNFGGVMPNAIWSLVHLLGTMKNADGYITIAGLHDQVVPPSNRERAATDALPVDLGAVQSTLGFRAIDRPEDRPYYDRLMFHPTLTINGLHGGYEGEGSKAVIPATAFAKCDMRLVSGQTPEYVMRCVADHVHAFAPDVEFRPLQGTPPARTPIDSPYATYLIEAVRAVCGSKPLIQASLGATLPTHVFSTILGLPTFLLPFANADEANHAPNENISIDCFMSGIRISAALFAALGRSIRMTRKDPSHDPDNLRSG
ncbi:M20/M25/M40 family metallo-hydrolase [Rhizobium lusitanum]|uniref:M20/M25/M40 family metallo-hydrolase n=1 Tax=Rhizobium lusitanum TaxID=293958 RepID=A0A6L9UCI8_9HYPH|nr:M20/M25/M40 family metallo-hydrolase [Rhizobium lusitanum]NEI73623.1 M20/M25/M40 family metallo-hydrolase [Rhizobium lusitanum]